MEDHPSPLCSASWVSPLIRLREFIWNVEDDAVFDGVLPEPERDECLSDKMGVSLDVLYDLQKICDPSTLIPELLEEEVDLMTLRCRKSKQSSTKLLPYYIGEKQRTVSMDVDVSYPARSALTEADSVKVPDIVITVSVLQSHPSREMRLDRDYLVLGSHSLKRFRDAIMCPADWTYTGEWSNDICNGNAIQKTANSVYKSGFIYIEGVFYNDMSDSSNCDYSDVVIKWSNDKNRGLGPFEKRNMENVTFSDLSLRLGQPYLYTHQGDCEHILIFRDLRMLHHSDCQQDSLYPLIVARDLKPRRLCAICKVHSSKWYVSNSALLALDPCFMCDICLKFSHYHQGGKKIDDNFTVHPYIDYGNFN